MATYKVIQDIEAEDKLVGPLTLRQFIYAAIAAICAYLSFLAIAHGFWEVLFVLGPPMLFTGFFAFPWGRDQSTEVWALAKIRFYVMSRKRLWDQSGVKDLVTITAPKRETRTYTNGLSQNEVQSRLNALANTLDSRGWAVKNVYTAPLMQPQIASDSDRLINLSNLPQAVPTDGVTAADDMLDEENNSRAHQLTEMVAASTANRKQQLLKGMRSGPVQGAPARNASDGWFTRKPLDIPMPSAPIDATPVAGATISPAEEAALSKALHDRQTAAHVVDANEHMKTIEPISAKPAPAPQAPPIAQPVAPPAPVTPLPDPATITLANNNDLSVAAISRIANKKDRDNGSGEVVISLHNHD